MSYRFSALLCITALFFFFLSGTTFADDKEKSEDPAGCTTEIESNWYENIGIALSITGVIQGLFGTREEVNPDSEGVDATILGRLEATAPVDENGNAYMLVEFGKGEGVNDRIETWTNFNDTAFGDDKLTLSELWYEHVSPEGKSRFKIGHIDPTKDFDTNMVANCECTQFMSSGFINNPAVEFPDDNGAGAMCWLTPSDDFDFGIVLADADADWDDIFDNMFCMIELDFKGKLKNGDGNYRFYGWFNSKDHPELLNDEETSNGHGFGFSIDQVLNENVNAFARYGWQRNDVYEIGSAWSFGIEFVGQKENVFGLAYGRVVMGDDKEELDLSDGIASGNEHHFEIYYRIKVNDKLSITPDLQWMRNVGAVRDNGNAWVLGIRAFLEL